MRWAVLAMVVAPVLALISLASAFFADMIGDTCRDHGKAQSGRIFVKAGRYLTGIGLASIVIFVAVLVVLRARNPAIFQSF